jgi:hypothetical protein
MSERLLRLFLHSQVHFSHYKDESLYFISAFLYFHRFWFFKIAAIVGIMVGSFYIPGGPFTSGMAHFCGVSTYKLYR